MLLALAVRMDEMANLWQQLFDQHGLIQTQAVLGLLRRNDREEEDSQKKRPPAVSLILHAETGERLWASTRGVTKY